MIDLADLKAWLKVSGSTNNTLLEELERRAVAFVESQTGVQFSFNNAYTTTVPGTGTAVLFLPRAPAGAITEVREIASIGETGTEIVEADDDGFVVRGSRLVRKRGSVWSSEYEYALTYPAGWAAGEEPGDIRQLVMDLVAAKWRQRGKEGTRSESISGYSYTMADLMELPQYAATINSYRRARI